MPTEKQQNCHHLFLQKFETDIVVVFYCLATNEKLKTLDISGNQMGNKGATALGKAIQTNETLEVLRWDLNGTTLQGFQAFNFGLRRNVTVKSMPLPINDISGALKGNEAQQLVEVVNTMENYILRNQSPTARYQTQMSGGSTDGNSVASQLAFLNSGQRELVQKAMFKIKATGRKVQDDKKIVLEDAEVLDQCMTDIYGLKDGIHSEFEIELKKSLMSVVSTTAPIFGNMKTKLITQLIEQVRRYEKSFDEETIRRLQMNLQFGGKDLPDEDLSRVMEAAVAELGAKSSAAFHSTVSIASDYLYEKLLDKIQDIVFELTEAVQSEISMSSISDEKNKKATPVTSPSKTLSQSQLPTQTAPAASTPQKSQPKVPPKPKKATPIKKSESKASKEEETVHVEELPKTDSNLEHATKDRPGIQAKRKPPSRKPRPAPPSAGTTM